MFRRVVWLVVVVALTVVVGFLGIWGPYAHTPWLSRTVRGASGGLWLILIPIIAAVAGWVLLRPKVK